MREIENVMSQEEVAEVTVETPEQKITKFYEERIQKLQDLDPNYNKVRRMQAF